MSELAGVKVVVTRARHQASALVDALREAGATPIEIPTIEIVDTSDGGAALAAAACELPTYDWVVFTSSNAVERLTRAGSLNGPKLAVVGAATLQTLEAAGYRADLVPSVYLADALVEAFDDGPGRVLFPSAAITGPTIVDGLTAKGWDVQRVDTYRTEAAVATEAARQAIATARVVTFASGSSFDRFCELYGVDQLPSIVACIGPVTAATVRHHGVEPQVVATEHTVEGLVRALAEFWGRREF